MSLFHTPKDVARQTKNLDPNQKNGQFKEMWLRLRKNPRAMVALGFILLIILLAIFADVLVNYYDGCVKQDLTVRLQKPSWEHLFGTDQYGRDILARIVHGTRIALLLGFGATLISLTAATVLACLAAFYGGWVDNVITRAMDILSTIPGLVLSLAICAGLGSGMWQLIVALAASGIAGFVRMIRSKALSVVNMEYMEASRSLGAGDGWLMLKHLIPNILSIILIQGTMSISFNVLVGATLSFIGLGVVAPTPEWGSMLSDGISYFATAPYMVWAPGITMILTSLAINTFGDCLRDAFDPQLKGKA